LSESTLVGKDRKVFSRLKISALFTLFAFVFISIGIFLAASFNWSSTFGGGAQAVTPSKIRFTDSPDNQNFEAENPFVKVAEEVCPAVVNISAEKKVKGVYTYEFDPEDILRRFFGETPDRKLPAQKSQSLGSGFIFRKDGYILTNNHVVAGADNISVKFPGGDEYTAKVVGLDKDTDIAVLKIDVKENLPTVTFGDSDSLRVGEWVMAIGNPFPILGLDRTVTVGVVSAKGRGNLRFGPGDETPQYQNYIQTDASINPGNSGGPLVNIHGEVIGINAALTNPNGEAVNIGIGFAVPINLAKSVIPDLVEKGKVSRGYLGIGFQEIDKNTAEALNLPSTEGVLVQRVMPDTPADRAGIKTGDVITQFNGHQVMNGSQFMMMVAQVSPGEDATIEIFRNGKKLTRSLELADREKSLATTQETRPIEVKNEDWLGLVVSTCTDQLASQYEVEFHPGVIIVGVTAGSLAEQAGFLGGDIIAKVNDREIADMDAYQKTIQPLQNHGKAVLFLVYRNGEPFFTTVKAE
jgi:Do/DeqQ family serine protease